MAALSGAVRKQAAPRALLTPLGLFALAQLFHGLVRQVVLAEAEGVTSAMMLRVR